MIDKTLSVKKGKLSPGELAVSDFVNKATEDYISMRLMLSFQSMLYDSVAHAGGKCMEKMMKAFLLLGQHKTFDEIKDDLGHDLKKILGACTDVDSFFEDSMLADFADNYGNIGHTLLGYGMSGKYVESYGVNLKNIINLVDKVYLGTLMRSDYGIFFMSSTNVASLFYSSPMSKIRLSVMRNSDVDSLKRILSMDNNYIQAFSSSIQGFYERMIPAKEEK